MSRSVGQSVRMGKGGWKPSYVTTQKFTLLWDEALDEDGNPTAFTRTTRKVLVLYGQIERERYISYVYINTQQTRTKHTQTHTLTHTSVHTYTTHTFIISISCATVMLDGTIRDTAHLKSRYAQ